MIAESTAEDLTNTWVVKSVRLKFAFAGVLLRAVPFPALALDGYFGHLGTDPAEPRAPLDLHPAEVRAALIHSHPVRQKLSRVAFADGFIRYAPRQYRRFFLDLNGAFEDYLKQLSHNPRKQLRRTLKQFTAMNDPRMDWREFRQPGEMAEYHRLAREVSARTYQEHLVDAGLPSGSEFLDQITAMAANDAVRGYILFADGKPIAYHHCPVEGDVIVHERTGYDPDYRHLRPGLTLLFLLIERLFTTDRFSRFDFGRGEFPYKDTYSTGSVLCADIYYFRRTPSNCALVFAHSALDATWTAISGILDRLHLKDRLKRLLRLHYGKS
jgi:CelD/BcsL family acetyltransferase involved in cellulose biosynthesis